jgi:hypothetical protein
MMDIFGPIGTQSIYGPVNRKLLFCSILSINNGIKTINNDRDCGREFYYYYCHYFRIQ